MHLLASLSALTEDGIILLSGGTKVKWKIVALVNVNMTGEMKITWKPGNPPHPPEKP